MSSVPGDVGHFVNIYIYNESKSITPGQRLLQQPVGQGQHVEVQNSHIKRNLEHQGRGVAIKKGKNMEKIEFQVG